MFLFKKQYPLVCVMKIYKSHESKSIKAKAIVRCHIWCWFSFCFLISFHGISSFYKPYKINFEPIQFWWFSRVYIKQRENFYIELSAFPSMRHILLTMPIHHIVKLFHYYMYYESYLWNLDTFFIFLVCFCRMYHRIFRFVPLCWSRRFRSELCRKWCPPHHQNRL